MKGYWIIIVLTIVGITSLTFLSFAGISEEVTQTQGAFSVSLDPDPSGAADQYVISVQTSPPTPFEAIDVLSSSGALIHEEFNPCVLTQQTFTVTIPQDDFIVTVLTGECQASQIFFTFGLPGAFSVDLTRDPSGAPDQYVVNVQTSPPRLFQGVDVFSSSGALIHDEFNPCVLTQQTFPVTIPPEAFPVTIKTGECQANAFEFVFPFLGVRISSDVNDNVSVDPGETGLIDNGATVDGNVQVDGGDLTITSDSTITGNVEVSNGGSVIIEDGSTVEGNVIISGTGSIVIEDTSIDGNIETQNLDTVTITDSNVNGNIISDNDVNVAITGNTVNGNLEISGSTNCSQSNNNVNGNNSGCS